MFNQNILLRIAKSAARAKKKFVKKALKLYYALHSKAATKFLLFIYAKRKSFILPLVVGAASGLCQPPVYMFFVLPITITIFLRLLDFTQTNASNFKTAFLFFAGYCGVALYWPAYGSYIFGYPWYIAALFAIVVILLASVVPAIVFTFFVKISAGIQPFRRTILFACFWVAAEYIRSFVVFHFPFGVLGYSLGGASFLFQFASVFGVLGLSFILVVWSLSFYNTLFTQEKHEFIVQFRNFIIINILFAVMVIAGLARVTQQKTNYTNKTAAIVQANASITQNQNQIYEKYATLTQFLQEKTNYQINVIIWPEGAGIPPPYKANFGLSTQAFNKEQILNIVTPSQLFIFSGTLVEDGNVFNTMYLHKNGKTQMHKKHFLVPYGEYLPIVQKYKFGKAMARGAGIGFTAGEEISTIQTEYGNILPLICYEVTYSGQINKGGANYIVNITNDEWFGRTSGPWQHLTIARFRAVEEGLPVLRASNNGVSAIVDPNGRILHKTKLFREGIIVGRIPKKTQTLFSIWGNWPLLFFIKLFIGYYITYYQYKQKPQQFNQAFINLLARYNSKKQDPNRKKRY